MTSIVINSSVAWWKLFVSKWQTRVLNILSPIRWLSVVLDIREAAVLKVKAEWRIAGSGSPQWTGRESFIELLGSEVSIAVIGNESYKFTFSTVKAEMRLGRRWKWRFNSADWRRKPGNFEWKEVSNAERWLAGARKWERYIPVGRKYCCQDGDYRPLRFSSLSHKENSGKYCRNYKI